MPSWALAAPSSGPKPEWVMQQVADHMRYEHQMPMWAIARRTGIPMYKLKERYADE